MLFLQIRQELIDVLQKAGCPGRIETSRKRLKTNQSVRIGAVLFEKEVIEKDEGKRHFLDADGQHKRRKRFSRELSFNVIIGEADIEGVETIYEKFVKNLPGGIYVDGNWVGIEPVEADWLDDEDSILKAKCAVQLLVKCTGGTYTDTDYRRITDVEMTVERKGEHGSKTTEQPGT